MIEVQFNKQQLCFNDYIRSYQYALCISWYLYKKKLTFYRLTTNLKHKKICTLHAVFYSLCILTLCLLVIKFYNFYCGLLAFLNQLFRNTIRLSNSLDPDQVQHFVGSDLG